MLLNHNLLIKVVQDFLKKKLPLRKKEISNIKITTKILKQDILDSFLFIDLIMFLEKKFKKKINLSKINFKNLDLKKLYNLIVK